MSDQFERRVTITLVGCFVFVTLTVAAAVGVDIYLKVKNQGTRNIIALEVKP